MKLVVTEKNDAAQKIADLLGVKKPKADKVYSTPVYRFDVDGEEWVTIGLRGHILEPDFTPQIVYKKRGGWPDCDVTYPWPCGQGYVWLLYTADAADE